MAYSNCSVESCEGAATITSSLRDALSVEQDEGSLSLAAAMSGSDAASERDPSSWSMGSAA